MESRYIINIAITSMRQGMHGEMLYHHWGKLDVGTSESGAISKLMDTQLLFPFPQFKVEMTYWECVGRSKPEWRVP